MRFSLGYGQELERVTRRLQRAAECVIREQQVVARRRFLALLKRSFEQRDCFLPALFGGLRVVVKDDGTYQHVAVPVAAGMKVVLFIPDFEMPTAESRKLLPQTLSKDDAVHNIGRAALLVAALARGEWAALDAATQDRMHQPARARIFPGMTDIFAAAKTAGALGAYLSGSGSTIAAFAVEHEERIARAMMQEALARGYPGRTAITEPSDQGTIVVAQS